MRKNILFIDDDEDFLESYVEELKNSLNDVSIESALSAKEAIVKLDRQDYNVIISDYKMPVIDGLKFFDILDSKFPKIARIILSGYCNEEVIAELKDKNILYLHKPCGIDKLVETINLALERM